MAAPVLGIASKALGSLFNRPSKSERRLEDLRRRRAMDEEQGTAEDLGCLGYELASQFFGCKDPKTALEKKAGKFLGGLDDDSTSNLRDSFGSINRQFNEAKANIDSIVAELNAETAPIPGKEAQGYQPDGQLKDIPEKTRVWLNAFLNDENKFLVPTGKETRGLVNWLQGKKALEFRETNFREFMDACMTKLKEKFPDMKLDDPKAFQAWMLRYQDTMAGKTVDTLLAFQGVPLDLKDGRQPAGGSVPAGQQADPRKLRQAGFDIRRVLSIAARSAFVNMRDGARGGAFTPSVDLVSTTRFCYDEILPQEYRDAYGELLARDQFEAAQKAQQELEQAVEKAAQNKIASGETRNFAPLINSYLGGVKKQQINGNHTLSEALYDRKDGLLAKLSRAVEALGKDESTLNDRLIRLRDLYNVCATFESVSILTEDRDRNNQAFPVYDEKEAKKFQEACGRFSCTGGPADAPPGVGALHREAELHKAGSQQEWAKAIRTKIGPAFCAQRANHARVLKTALDNYRATGDTCKAAPKVDKATDEKKPAPAPDAASGSGS